MADVCEITLQPSGSRSPEAEGGLEFLELEEGSGSETETTRQQPSEVWVPGANSGECDATSDDAQVLVYNVVTRINALPLKLRRQVYLRLSAGAVPPKRSTYSRTTAARLLCLPVVAINRVMSSVKYDKSRGAFVPKPRLSQPAEPSSKDRELECRILALEAFTHLNRAALGVVADNGTAQSFKTECARLLQARANIATNTVR